MVTQPLALRREVVPGDLGVVREITEATGFFSPEEVEVAVDLVEEGVAKGIASGYHFLFAEVGGRTAGYSIFGLIACTVASYDLYWIAVHPDFQGQGVGRELLAESEREIGRLGGRRVYIETSSRAQYEPTRGFYLRNGYAEAAVLPDFYAPGDAKVVYVKELLIRN